MMKNRSLATTANVSTSSKPVLGRSARTSRKRLGFDSLEERTMLSITVAALGDSVTDEYQFYAPYRTAAVNWPDIISTLRPTQVDFGTYSATGAGRGQTRNQGYAQDWALQGMAAQGVDLAGYMATFENEYNGGYMSSNLPGLLTQPGGISNINVVNILIGGNDYFRAILAAAQTGLSFSNFPAIQKNFEATNAGIIAALQEVVPLIEAANPDTHIIIDTVPSVAATPIVQNALAALSPTLAAVVTGFINTEVNHVNYDGSPPMGPYTYESIKKFAADNNLGYVDANGLVTSFQAKPTFAGIYINPRAAGPVYTDMFVGDGIHPGTIAQGLLTNAIIAQIDAWYPSAITPLSSAEILQLAQNVQPKSVETLTPSARTVSPGQQVTFRSGVPTFPANFETSPAPPAMPGNIPYPAAAGLVTFFDTTSRVQIIAIRQLDPTGVATFSTNGLSPGLHQITAVYSGDSVYSPAVAQPVMIVVGPSPAQSKVFSFVEALPQDVVRRISTSKIKTWLGWVHHGAKPQVVERKIAKFVRSHPGLPSGAVAARTATVAQSATKRN
jgi:hypothetical protein